ncbi:MAG: 50S ribosomal protein L29 [Candidatus Roizmanbacteria bacterium]
MKKAKLDYKNLDIKELRISIKKINDEIQKLVLEVKVNPQKNTNLITNLKKQLASIMTSVSEKKEIENRKSDN